ncbi:ankyrin repeat domain-containing protein [Anatilimnocola sp. NA78]|uniref:ankyrin repeat domain-containing protein n=1 Tax=Anatilimnocola sp. NA78 TaxID=3415683 RepID=UPI003CE5C63E
MDAKETTKAIRTAIKQGDDQAAVSLICADQSQLSAITPFGTWLHVAAAYGRINVVKKLIEMGADMHLNAGIENATPLFMAAFDGHIEVLDYLLSLGAKADVSRPEGNPLFAAINQGHTQVAKRLIESGIDVHVKYKGTSGAVKDAHSYALDWGRKDIAALIEAAKS